METPADTSSPTPLRRRWGRVLLVTTGVVAILALAAVWLLYDGLYWSPVNYATSCRRPLADYCTGCPTLTERERSQGKTRSCGLGIWRVVVMQGYDLYSEEYFDRSGHLIAVFHVGGVRPDRCGRDWYGPLVLCRVAPRFTPVPTVSLPPGAPPPETIVVRTVVLPMVWR